MLTPLNAVYNCLFVGTVKFITPRFSLLHRACDMRELYYTWPDQLKKALDNWEKVTLKQRPRAIVVCGMGGSGIVGDFARSIAYTKGFTTPIIVVKDYSIPSFISKSDIVITISYSGSTIETIKCFKESLKRKCPIYVIASDGILEEYANKNNIPFLKITRGLVPRTTLPEMLVTLIGILNQIVKVMDKNEVIKCSDFLKHNIRSIENEAKYIAERLYAKIPIIVTYERYAPLAWRAKNEFNENSKIPSKVEIVPEWGHHDIVGWENPISPGVWYGVIIEDVEDINSSKLLDFVEYTLSSKGIRTLTIKLKGDNIFEKLMYGSLLIGFTSVSLAEIYGVNPLTTRSIAQYKDIIKKILEA